MGWVGERLFADPHLTWFDASKAFLPDFRHRALRHHAEGIFWAEEVFGPTLTNSDGRIIPVRWVGEQHVKEDLGWIPTLQDWFTHLRTQPWMAKVGDRKVGRGEVPPYIEARVRKGGEFAIPIPITQEANDQPRTAPGTEGNAGRAGPPALCMS